MAADHLPRYSQPVTRRVLISLLALVCLTLAGCGRYLTTGVAVVNGVGIGKEDLDRAASRLAPQALGGPLENATPDQRLELDRRAIVQLIQNELLRQLGVRLKVRVDSKAIDEQISQIRSDPRYANDADFAEALKQNGLTMASLRDQLSQGLLLEQIRKTVTGTIAVSDDELRKAYGDGGRFLELKVRHILFRVQGPDEATVRQRAEPTLAQLRGGADFATLAKERSEDPGSKDKGGDLGTVTQDSGFDETFFKAALALKVGQISDLVRTQFGFHIIRVDERTQKSFEQVRDQLLQEATDAKERDAFTDYIRVRVKEARIVVNPRYGDFDPSTLSINEHQFFSPPPPETKGLPTL